MKKLNKTGMAIVLVYIIMLGGLYILELRCHGYFCGFPLIFYVPFIPWFSINALEHVFLSMPLPLSYFIFSIANIVVLYFIGMLLSFIFEKFRKNNIT